MSTFTQPASNGLLVGIDNVADNKDLRAGIIGASSGEGLAAPRLETSCVLSGPVGLAIL
jgi:hypothetical protein